MQEALEAGWLIRHFGLFNHVTIRGLGRRTEACLGLVGDRGCEDEVVCRNVGVAEQQAHCSVEVVAGLALQGLQDLERPLVDLRVLSTLVEELPLQAG